MMRLYCFMCIGVIAGAAGLAGAADTSTHARPRASDVFERVLSPRVPWHARSEPRSARGAPAAYTNGSLHAVLVDSDPNRRWSHPDDCVFELRSLFRTRTDQPLKVACARANQAVFSAFVLQYGGGWGEPGFASLTLPRKESVAWRVGVDPDASGATPASMATYAILREPNTLPAQYDHWLCFLTSAASAEHAGQDLVLDVRRTVAPAEPTFYYPYDVIYGRARENRRIIRAMYRHPSLFRRSRSFDNPEQAADEYVDLIRDAANYGFNYDADRVALFLPYFGAGDQCRRPTALSLQQHRGDAAGNDCLTPWMSSGIKQCRNWMERFLDRYQAHGAPPPHRVLFDLETLPYPASGSVRIWDAVKRDPRFGDAELPGFDATLSDLHARAGAPEPGILDASYYAGPNRTWGRWYGGVFAQATDAALRAAAYEPIRTRYPDCRSSNYVTSANYDGCFDATDIAIPAYDKYKNYRYQPNAFAFPQVHMGFADQQSPELYALPENPGVTVRHTDDRMMAFARLDLNACLRSFGGASPERLAPWIMLPGHKAACTRSGSARMLALLRSRRIREAYIYNDWRNGSSNPENWNAFDKSLAYIWDIELTSVAVRQGAALQDSPQLLRYGLDDYHVARSEGGEVTLDVRFRPRFHQRYPLEGLCCRVEATAWGPVGDGIDVQVKMQTRAGRFESVGRPTQRISDANGDGTCDRVFVRCSISDGERFLLEGDQSIVRIAYSSSEPFIVLTDLVQLVGALDP